VNAGENSKKASLKLQKSSATHIQREKGRPCKTRGGKNVKRKLRTLLAKKGKRLFGRGWGRGQASKKKKGNGKL